MDDDMVLGIVVILSIASVLFLGSGITGMVISESCCFGPDCSAENLCDSATARAQSQQLEKSTGNLYVGLMIMLAMSYFLLTVYGKIIVKDKRH